jgi:hypothetical protein
MSALSGSSALRATLVRCSSNSRGERRLKQKKRPKEQTSRFLKTNRGGMSRRFEKPACGSCLVADVTEVR